MKKAAFYAGTRNLYPHMVTAAKSLISHSTVDEVWFLTEDDEFPLKVPDIVHNMNVTEHRKKYFTESGPNTKCPLTTMAFIHCCSPDLFPQYDRILKLDVDTLCVDNVDPLWELDIDKAWYALANEDLQDWHRPHPDGKYYNVGVVMYNLKKMREENAVERITYALNHVEYAVYENDALNLIGHYRIAEMPHRYNEAFCTGYTNNPAIIHYAGPPDWYEDTCNKVARLEYLQTYRNMSWKECMRKHANLSRSTDV